MFLFRMNYEARFCFISFPSAVSWDVWSVSNPTLVPSKFKECEFDRPMHSEGIWLLTFFPLAALRLGKQKTALCRVGCFFHSTAVSLRWEQNRTTGRPCVNICKSCLREGADEMHWHGSLIPQSFTECKSVVSIQSTCQTPASWSLHLHIHPTCSSWVVTPPFFILCSISFCQFQNEKKIGMWSVTLTHKIVVLRRGTQINL